MEAKPRILIHYEKDGKLDTFDAWMVTLNGDAGDLVTARLLRVKLGNFGDCKPVGEGVSELRIKDGPGFRIYFGQDGDKVVLLTGGTKRTQDKDIKNALNLWRGYKNG